MDSREFMQWFEKNVKVRWPKHRFEWTEVGDWHWRLGAFDAGTLTEAVRRHKAGEDYRIPSLKQVYAYAQEIRAAGHPQTPPGDAAKTSARPKERVFIMCTGKDFDGCGPVGRYLPVLVWPFGRTYTAEQVHNSAKALAARHADCYGGTWEVFTDTNPGEIMRKSIALDK